MNCKVCGAQLNGTEVVCPNCGTAIENTNVGQPGQQQMVNGGGQVDYSQPQNMQNPQVMPTDMNQVQQSVSTDMNQVPQGNPNMNQVSQGNPNMNQVPQGNPNMNQVPQGNPNMNQVPQGTALGANQVGVGNAKAKSGISATTVVLIVLLVLSIVGAVLYFTVFNEDDEAANSNSNADSATVATESAESVVSYGGYTFTIPNGYYSEENADLGLVLYNNKLFYSLLVDYTNTYEQYLEAFKITYPDQANNFEVKLGNRDYIIAVVSKGTECECVYITRGPGSAVFIGEAVNSSFTRLAPEEFNDLTSILDSAKQGSSTFAPGDDVDAGKNGIKQFTFDSDKFKFSSNEN